MNGFTFESRTRIVFGDGAVARLEEQIGSLGEGAVLLVTDPGVRGAGLLERATAGLDAAGRRWHVFDEVEPDPLDTTMERGAAANAAAGARVVVGLGGGSAIDTAKGIALLATNGGRIRDYVGRDRVRAAPVPVLAVPTTAGTGAEVSGNIAVTDAESHTKLSVRSPLNQPPVAVLDPALLATLPTGVAAQTSIDALSHAVEGYLSRLASPMTDRMALEAIGIAVADLAAFVGDRGNIGRAGRLLYASMLGGMIISNAPTGVDHALGRALGGAFGVPHGQAVGLFLPPTLRFNAAALPHKLAALRALFEGCPPRAPSPDDGEAVAAHVEALVRALGMPTRLCELGVASAQLPALAAVAACNTGANIRPASEAQLLALLEEVA
jgi:alcohol dehydrogenase